MPKNTKIEIDAISGKFANSNEELKITLTLINQNIKTRQFFLNKWATLISKMR